jgi:uncharacterized protein YprB with RNaseH-like and TPR domain
MTPDDDKKKALFEKLGLITGADYAKKRAEEPAVPPPSPIAPQSPAGGGTLQNDSARRLRERLGLMSGLEWRQRHEIEDEARERGDFEADKITGGQLIEGQDGQFLLVRTEYPVEHLHGHTELGAALESDPQHLAFFGNDETLVECNLEKTFFVDTETTGLSGGSGTVAFLIGVGRFKDGLFVLDQCFMRDYDDEEPMLEYLAQQFAECDTVVSFNGKSFDLPLLRTRFIQNRQRYRLDGTMHLDLVHTARRFWKRRLSNCSLGNLEREVLGVRRVGDVSSALIPQLWLEYLHTRDARPLQGVFYHHRMDILSLVTLVGMLSRQLRRADGAQFDHVEDQLSLVRALFRQRQYDKVVTLGRAFLDQDSIADLRRECLEMMGLACKRTARFADMQETLERWHRDFPTDAQAAMELAKHHEHRTRDLGRAERVCMETLERLEASAQHFKSIDPAPSQALLLRRLERIRTKLRKGRPNIAEIFDDE